MAEETKKNKKKPLTLTVATSPHLVDAGTSRRVMYEVAAGTLPAAAMSIYLFRGTAAALLIACVVCCVATEWIFNRARGKVETCFDGSAIVTGLILGLSLPASLPIWAAAVGSVVAIAVSKMLFGGLGANIFNPAMVGRAFLMASFGMMMTNWVAPATEPIVEGAEVVAVSQATPLALAKQAIKDATNDEKPVEEKATAQTVNAQLKKL